MEGDNIFIVGGQTNLIRNITPNSALCLQIYQRELEPLMSMASFLVVMHEDILYVRSRINDTDELSNRRVQAFDLTDASAG